MPKFIYNLRYKNSIYLSTSSFEWHKEKKCFSSNTKELRDKYL